MSECTEQVETPTVDLLDVDSRFSSHLTSNPFYKFAIRTSCMRCTQTFRELVIVIARNVSAINI